MTSFDSHLSNKKNKISKLSAVFEKEALKNPENIPDSLLSSQHSLQKSDTLETSLKKQDTLEDNFSSPPAMKKLKKTDQLLSSPGNLSDDYEEKVEVTLNHTPVLSDDMKIFSHHHEHYEHTEKKRQKKRKVKTVLAYSLGSLALFGLSTFGFYSQSSFYSDPLEANISHESFHFVAPEISGKTDIDEENLKKQDSYQSCIEHISPDADTDVRAAQEEKCKELFPDSGVRIEVVEKEEE
jgi:hypothetical protein